jgi:hypothetical protein
VHINHAIVCIGQLALCERLKHNIIKRIINKHNIRTKRTQITTQKILPCYRLQLIIDIWCSKKLQKIRKITKEEQDTQATALRGQKY